MMMKNINKLEEKRRKRLEGIEKHNKFTEMVNRAENGQNTPKKVSPIAKFRAISRSIYEFIHLLRTIKAKELNKRKDNIDNFKDSLILYVDVARNWLLG